MCFACVFSWQSHAIMGVDSPGGARGGIDFNPPPINAAELSFTEIGFGAPSRDSEFAQRFVFNPVVEVNTNRATLLTSFDLDLPPNLIGMDKIKFLYNSNNIFNKGFGVGWELNLPKIEKKNNIYGSKTYSISGLLGASALVQTKTTDDYIVYRPELEERFLKFIHKSSGEWLVQNPSGPNWYFSRDGLPTKTKDNYGNKIHFEWEREKLISITEEGNWEIRFNYTNLTSGIIENIELQAHKTGERRVLEFFVEGEYLEKVSWQGGDLPLFWGEYEESPYEYTYLSSEFGEIKKDGEYVFQKDFDQAVFKKKEDLDYRKTVLYRDITGDRRQDRVSIIRPDVEKIIEQRLMDIEYRTKAANSKKLCEARPKTSLREVQEWFSNFRSEVHVDVATIKNGEFSYQRDDSLSFIINDIVVHVSEDYTSNPFCDDILVYDIEVEISTPKIVDINGSGLNDFVLCQSSGLNSFEEMFEKDIRGDRPLIYTQKVDKERVDYILLHDLEHPENYLNGTRFFSRDRALENFNCHDQSFFYDFNLNGALDVFNGQELILRDSEDVLETIEVDFTQYFKLPRRGQGPSDDQKRIIINEDSSGRLRVLYADQAFFHVEKKSWITESDQIVPGERRKLLSRFKSPFGGYKEVSYTRNAGQLGVSAVTTKSSQGEKLKQQTFEYTDSIFDFYTGAFIGHERTVEAVNYGRDNFKNSRIEKEYYSDANRSTLLYETRARLNGRLYRTQITDERNLDTLKESKSILDAYELDFGRILPIVRESRVYSFSPGDKVESMHLTRKKVDSWEKDNGVYISPQSTRQSETFFKDLRNIFNTSADRTLVSEYRFDHENYNQLLVSKTLFDSDHNRTLYSEYNSQGSVTLQRQNHHEVSFEYDDLGRIVRHTDKLGAKNQYFYRGRAPFAYRVLSEIDEFWIEKSHFSGETTSLRNRNGLEEAYLFNSDGLKVKTLRRSPEYGEVEVFSLNLDGLTENKFEVKKAAQTFQLKLSDFGEIERVSTQLNDQEIVYFDGKVLFGKTLYDQYSENWFDPLGRPLRTERALSHSHELMQIEHVYHGHCEQRLLGGVEVYSECKNPWGKKILESHLGENNIFGHDLFGNIESLNEGVARWSYNDRDEVASFHFEEMSDQRFFSENYGEGTQITGRDGQSVFSDKYNRRVGYISEGLRETISIDSIYTGSLLYSRSVAIDEREEVREVFTHDSYENITHLAHSDFDKYMSYDKYGRITSEKMVFADSSKNKNFELGYLYAQETNQLLSVYPIIRHITYNEEANPTQIEFENGLEINLFYLDDKQTLKRLVYVHKSGESENVLYSKRYGFNSLGQIEYESSSFDDYTSSKNHEYDESFRLRLREADKGGVSRERDKYGRLVGHHNFKFTFSNDDLVGIDDGINRHRYFYDENSKLFAGCRHDSEFSTMSEDCFYMPSRDEVFVGGQYLRLIHFSAMPIALYFEGQFYPVVTGLKGEVKGVLSPDGQNVLFIRDYDEWGNYHLVLNSKMRSNSRVASQIQELEQKIVWNWDGLLSDPFLDDKTIKWSLTRVYVDGKWASIDPMFKWSPHRFESSGNWNPFVYCDNDPVNCLDVTGNWAMIPLVVGAGFGAVNGGIYAYRNDQDLLKSIVVGGATGASMSFGGAGPLLARSSLAAISGFTTNLGMQAVVNREINMNQAFVAAAMGATFGSFSLAANGVNFSTAGGMLAGELAVGLSLMPVDIGLMFSLDHFDFLSMQNGPLIDDMLLLDDGFFDFELEDNGTQ